MSHPYHGLPDHCFWSKAMTAPPPGQVDPVTNSKPILPGQKVATMGSCFAQHLARHIQLSGLDYFVPEAAPAGWSAEEARKQNYGVFSARYGNVYTTKQAVQLFDRAFGEFLPKDDVWKIKGGYVDPFRPRIDSAPKSSPDEVRQASVEHLAHVRRVFTESDWLVFTLGLTEAWRSRVDGAVYPLAPGTAGGEYDPDLHEFVNFTAAQVSADLKTLISKVRSVNPSLNFLLTVSPVPLIATYEQRHVWTSTTLSKAVLRVAADEADRAWPNVTYFPSYEIITSPAAEGRYYNDDLREVNPIGVRHVMRMFEKHFMLSKPVQEANAAKSQVGFTTSHAADFVCDEEAIEQAMARSGLQRD